MATDLREIWEVAEMMWHVTNWMWRGERGKSLEYFFISRHLSELSWPY